LGNFAKVSIYLVVAQERLDAKNTSEKDCTL
jgi:hypothetical protein